MKHVHKTYKIQLDDVNCSAWKMFRPLPLAIWPH